MTTSLVHHPTMNVSSNNESILLFGKLSFLPLLRVRSHLNASSLVLVSLISEKWKRIVENGGTNLTSVWDIDITPDGVYIQLTFRNAKNEKFGFRFKEDVELKYAEDVKVHQENNFATFYHKSSQQLEESFFKVFQLLNFLFPPASYGRITVSLDSRCSSPEFVLHFLLNLPHGTADFIGLCGDQEVDCGDLVTFLRNVKVVRTYNSLNTLDIRVKMKNLIKCNEILLECAFIRIDDARFLSIDSLKQLKFGKFHAGHNDFTSEDFNVFLHAWMENRGFRVVDASFDIREDQNIRIEKVMEGLNPHFGTPRIRDRWKFDHPGGKYGHLYPTAIDLAEGWDITNNHDGMIGTVLLEPNRLTFVTWSNPFRLQGYVKYLENDIASGTRYMENLNRDRERIQKKADAGKMELFLNQQRFLENYPEIMRTVQDRLVAACGTKEKLLSIWKNDETVYLPPSPNLRIDNPLPSCFRSIIVLGSADIALDAIPLAFQFTRREFGGEILYAKMEGRCEIRISTVTDVASIDKELLSPATALLYAYSDSDSFDRLSVLFISLRKVFKSLSTGPIRWAQSLLVHLPGSNNLPDPFDVESFQRNSWSDAAEFDQDSLINIEEFIVPIL